jgi:hypothetical protein
VICLPARMQAFVRKGPFPNRWDYRIWGFEGGFGKIEVVVALVEYVAVWERRFCSINCRGKPAFPSIATYHPTAACATPYSIPQQDCHAQKSDEYIALAWIVRMSEAYLMMRVHGDRGRSRRREEMWRVLSFCTNFDCRDTIFNCRSAREIRIIVSIDVDVHLMVVMLMLWTESKRL